MTASNENRTQVRRPKRKRKQHSLLVKILQWCALVFALALVSGIGVFAYYAKDAPELTQDMLRSGGNSSLYSYDGKFLMSLGSGKRKYVDEKQIPTQLKDAIISIEDKRFYSEKLGIDPIRIVASALANVAHKGISAGGSTITQQLVKLTAFSTDASQRTLKRKAQEAWLAMKVEHDYSKGKILEYYVNKVFMNYDNYGMGTAADYYYGKELKDLDLAQTALIAGMPNAPVSFDPYVYPKQAKYRRDLVLKAMLDNNKISEAEYRQAVKESIKQGLQARQESNESHLRTVDDSYIKEAISEVQAKGFDPYKGNLKITLNIDQDAQTYLYNLVNNGTVPFTNDKMQVGASVVDPASGRVIAIIGGRKLPSVQLGLNRAVQTTRSTGSSVKPVLDYAPAIEYLHWPTSHILDDSKYIYPGTNIQLYDWDNAYMGKMSMRFALEQSRNVPAVKALRKVGLNRAALFARKMNVNVGANYGLSVAIGANASSLQMAGAFGAFANGGTYHKPTFVAKIETADGVVHNYSSTGKRVMKASTAYMITDMLKGVLTNGSGTTARTGLYEAGKTGTVKYSDDELVRYPAYASTPKDSWFVGYTRRYSIGVWTGYDNLKDGTISGAGTYSAQLVYKYMMTYLMKNRANRDWTRPSSVVRKRIVNGTEDEVAGPGRAYTWQLFIRGYEPEQADYVESDSNSSESSVSSSSSSETSSSSSAVDDEEQQDDADTNQSDQGTQDQTGQGGQNSTPNN